MDLTPFEIASIWSGTCFSILFAGFRYFVYWDNDHVFFNPQDYWKAMEERRVPKKALPEESSTATCEPLISQYTGVVKVMIGLAAASISFGGLATTGANATNPNVFIAKMLLAFSIGFGLLFSITMINFYENYLHDLESYSPNKISLVEASGLTSVVCFALGYGYWAWHF